MIEAVKIGDNRYATEGSAAINLYNANGAEGLTLGQLVISMCMKAAIHYEDASVRKANAMTETSRGVTELSGVCQQVIANTLEDWPAVRKRLVDEYEVTGLPESIAAFPDRITAANAIKERLEALVRYSQHDAIDLQSLLARRDVAHSAASNSTLALGTSMTGMANNF